MKIIDNFLSEKAHTLISERVTGGFFPYLYSSGTATPDDKSYFMFNHALFWDNQPCTSSYDIITLLFPLMAKVEHSKLLRAKVNLYTKSNNQIVTGFHTDQDAEHKVLLYSVNSNNGYTLFKDGSKVPSVANQAVIFDGKLEHSSVTQTDENIRVNININFN